LADAGYVSYRRGDTGHGEIVGHQYVGRARFDGIELQVAEKVPGTLLALIGVATGADLRMTAAGSPETEFSAISRHLMGEFTRAAGRYIANRRKPRFVYREAQGPMLAGRLDMTATMRLHAAGRLGVFAFSQGAVVRDDPLDRVVLAGLKELDRTGPALELDAPTIYDARWLAGALDEVRDARFITTPLAEFLADSDSIEHEKDRTADEVDLARLAVVALLHRGFEPDGTSTDNVPRAWFVDLEKLFEKAVREVLRELLPAYDVDLGRVYERRMFSNGSDNSRVNPDIVIHSGPTVIATGDVKYKTLLERADEDRGNQSGPRRKGAARSDLYQLLVHAAALDGDRAFLIYAAERSPSLRFLGLSATGARTWVAEVRPTHLRRDLDWLLREDVLLGGLTQERRLAQGRGAACGRAFQRALCSVERE
jgi:McrBC 5-methylcytosine restriction system component